MIPRSSSSSAFSVIVSPQAMLKVFRDAVALGGEQVRGDGIVDIGEVTRLLAVSVDLRGRPVSIAVMNRGITAAYSESGSWRGPKTLK